MNRSIQNALSVLEGAEKKIGALKAFVGLDGFVDSIVRAVDKRRSFDSFDPIETIKAFAERISRAAGKSTNIELVYEQQKLGGNGPIMANSLAAYGVKVRYVGNLGYPEIHPVFIPMTQTCDVISIAEPGFTDALEFDDGKLMLGKPQALSQITWATLEQKVGVEKLLNSFEQADLIALTNWTQVPFMSDIWDAIQQKIAPKLTGPKRILLFDLADPQKRTPEDLKRGLRLISNFEKYFRTILGLNESEAHQIAEVLEISSETGGRSSLSELSMQIRQKLSIGIVVIHPREFACAAHEKGETFVEGPFCAKPVISTGAGDHFNAGFSLGILLANDLEVALQIGVATSGYYVRTAKSPTLDELRTFLSEI